LPRPAVPPAGGPPPDRPAVPDGGGSPGAPLLCACFRLTGADLRRIIDERRCVSVEDVADATGACRGCQTCRPDIEALLADAAARRGPG
jgi:NAD(P)H-nitrite reductase large subunit